MGRRRQPHLLPFDAKRRGAAVERRSRRQRPAPAFGHRGRYRRVRPFAQRRQSVLHQACPGRKTQVVGGLPRPARLEGADLRRPDGASLGLLGRRQLPAPVRCRDERRPDGRGGGHHAGRAVGCADGALFRRGRDRVEQRGHAVGLHLQEDEGQAVRAQH